MKDKKLDTTSAILTTYGHGARVPLEDKARVTYRSKGTDAIGRASVANWIENEEDQYSAVAFVNGVAMNISNRELIPAHGVMASKLTTIITEEFTRRVVGGKYQVEDLRIKKDIAEIGERTGYDVVEHTKNCLADKEKERRRVNNSLKKLSKIINRVCLFLYNVELTWTERIGGEEVPINGTRVIAGRRGDPKEGGYGFIFNNYLDITLSPDLANVLVKMPQTTTHPAIMKIDANHDNAYFLGRYISHHYYIRSNAIRDRLKVSSLLTAVNLPSIDEVRKQGGSWRQKIREPLENALIYLVEAGFLSSWEYALSGGNVIPYNDATFQDYEEWIETLVKYDVTPLVLNEGGTSYESR